MADEADPRQRFELLYGSLCEIQRALLENSAKVAGFLLLAIGWLATSDSARAFLQVEPFLRSLAALAVVGVVLLSWWISWNAFAASRRTYDLMAGLAFMPPEYFETRRVSSLAFVVYLLGNGLLGLVLVAVLVGLKR